MALILNFVISLESHETFAARFHPEKFPHNQKVCEARKPHNPSALGWRTFDPRLMEPRSVIIAKPSTCRSGVDICVSPVESVAANTDSCSEEISTRRPTRGSTKATNGALGPESVSQPWRATRSSQKRDGAKERLGEMQREKRLSGRTKISITTRRPR